MIDYIILHPSESTRSFKVDDFHIPTQKCIMYAIMILTTLVKFEEDLRFHLHILVWCVIRYHEPSSSRYHLSSHLYI